MDEIIFNLQDPNHRLEMYNAPVGPTKGDVNYYDPDFSNATGRLKGTILDKNERQRRRSVREKNTSTRVNSKAAAKQTNAKAQELAAKGLGSPSASVKLPSAPPAVKSGLSTGAKIGIGVGALLVVGVITFLIIKKKKK